MASKTTTPSWEAVKGALEGLSKAHLTKLIADLYRLSKANQDFMHARYALGGDPLKPYKEIIEAGIAPDIESKLPVRIASAKAVISDYAKAVGDVVSEVELMVYFVECGTSFTLTYGDINASFYNALVSMYARAIKRFDKLPEEEKDQFQARLHKLVVSTTGMGWNYHDDLGDLYRKAFGEK